MKRNVSELGVAVLVAALGMSAIGAVQGDRPSFGPLSPPARPVERQYLVSGTNGDPSQSAANVEEWVARRRRGVQSDLHVYSRPIDDDVRAARGMEFLNHRLNIGASHPYP